MQVVHLHVPSKDEMLSNRVMERFNRLHKHFRYPIEMIGLPTASFFKGLDRKTVSCFFWDEFHLNRNGSDYFTKMISPALPFRYTG